MIGETFGRLTVLEKTSLRTKNREIKYKCVCSCRNLALVTGTGLRLGRTRSCGCLHKEVVSKIAIKAGKENAKYVEGGLSKDHPLYKTWGGMKQRCYNSNHMHYKHYGGRGIEVCERWLNSFSNFVEDMGERPEGHTLDRINNNGNYTPDNCKWSTVEEQASNRGGY